MKQKNIFKTISWLLISITFGFMPLWVKICSAIDTAKIFNVNSILTDCSILYFCSAATISVCADYFYNTKNKYVLLKELKSVIGLPLFIFFWTIIVTLRISSLPENRLNMTTILLHTIVVTIATIVYIVSMKFTEFSKLNSI